MIGVIVAELMSGSSGLGSLIKYASFSMQGGLVILGVLLIGFWGMASGEVMRRIERSVEVWRPS
jgi:ABC-type nitrate/sulfonate/bicarbonate transport system permease component